MRSTKKILMVLFAISVSACATNNSNQITFSDVKFTNGEPCTLLFNHNFIFPDKMAQDLWFTASKQAITGVESVLQQNKVAFHTVIIEPSDTHAELNIIRQNIIENRCQKVFKVTAIKQVTSEFGFDFELLALENPQPVGSNYQYTFVSKFKKSYRYPFTSEVLKTLSLSGVGKNAANEMLATHAIE